MSTFARVGAVLSGSGLSRGRQIALCVCLGVVLGLAVAVGRIANATSYLSDAPETCVNCHVMGDAYVSWQRGSHGKVARCVDCHVPHTNPLATLAFKAADGMKHSAVFTVGAEPQVLRLSAAAEPVVQANCVRCHAEALTMIRLAGSKERTCWDCHGTIHSDVHGLSASPRVLRPKLPDAGF